VERDDEQRLDILRLEEFSFTLCFGGEVVEGGEGDVFSLAELLLPPGKMFQKEPLQVFLLWLNARGEPFVGVIKKEAIGSKEEDIGPVYLDKLADLLEGPTEGLVQFISGETDQARGELGQEIFHGDAVTQVACGTTKAPGDPRQDEDEDQKERQQEAG